MRQAGDAGGSLPDVGGADPEAVHPGVDLEVHRQGPAAGGGLVVQGGGAGGIVDGGLEFVADGRGDVGGGHRAHDEDGRGDAGLAQGNALFDEGDRQHLDALFFEGLGHRHRPVTVGVGLDDAHEAHIGLQAGPQGADVRADRAQVDFGERGSRHFLSRTTATVPAGTCLVLSF